MRWARVSGICWPPARVRPLEMVSADAKLRAIFLAELDERTRALERDLLALERVGEAAPPSDLVTQLFRAAHSLKGAAAAANVDTIVHACHCLEEVFAAMRDSRLRLSGSAFRLFFAAIDGFADAARRLRDGEALDAAPLALLLPQLNAATLAPAAAMSAPAAPAVAVPSGREPAVPRSGGADVAVTVRVAAEKLDRLLAQSAVLQASAARGDAVMDGMARLSADIARCRDGQQSGARLRQIAVETDRVRDGLIADRRALTQAAAALHDEIRRLRMQPFALACQGFERVVRDLAAATGKMAELLVVGGTVELDRAVIERLHDLLLHLVRNAVDHGIEPAETRRAAGKRPVGQITIAATLKGSRIAVSVADDGAGLDLDAIAARAEARGLPPAAGSALAHYVFLPGLSTLAAATQISGRGVGLDAVKTGVEAMRGSVDVTFEPGRFARFVLDLPLTLTSIRALIVMVGGRRFALDAADVARLVRVSGDRLASVAGASVLVLEDGPVPVAALSELLDVTAARPSPGDSLPLVVIVAGGRKLALLVDDFVGEQEVLVRPLGRRLAGLPLVAGGTFLDGGMIALILNAGGLLRAASDRKPAPIAPAATKAAQPAARVLLADDSLTTRSLERSILEVAGYEVIAAGDGEEAWRLLQEHGADIVVSDVEMPGMDGFALTEAIRGSRRFADIPVVLVTGLATDADRRRGLDVGASAYLVKSAFDAKSLLDAIGRLV